MQCSVKLSLSKINPSVFENYFIQKLFGATCISGMYSELLDKVTPPTTPYDVENNNNAGTYKHIYIVKNNFARSPLLSGAAL